MRPWDWQPTLDPALLGVLVPIGDGKGTARAPVSTRSLAGPQYSYPARLVKSQLLLLPSGGWVDYGEQPVEPRGAVEAGRPAGDRP